MVVATASAEDSPPAIDTTANCDSDLFSLIRRCILYVMQPDNPKEVPSQACCDTYQKVDTPCLCSKVDKGIEEIINMPKVIYVADYWKRPLTPGTKCGSEWPCVMFDLLLVVLLSAMYNRCVCVWFVILLF